MPKAALRKRRTREHIIADLSINHVERFALHAGFTTQVIRSDYGVDLTVTTFDKDGYQEPGLIFFQVKATDQFAKSWRGDSVPVIVDERDLRSWLRENHPIVLVLFDAKNERAYWGHVQEYFCDASTEDEANLRLSRTMRLSLNNRITDQAMMKIADLKRRIYPHTKG
jgi:hypothetical protein